MGDGRGSPRGGAATDDDGFGPPLTGETTGADGFGPALRGTAGRSSGDGGAGERGTEGDAAPSEDPGFGPAVVRGRAPGRARRVLRVGLVAAAVLGLVGLGLGGGLLVYAAAVMPETRVEGLERAGGGRMNVLVVGSDSREGLSEAELQALGTEAVQGRRTDSIFLLSVRGGSAALLSFPRDLLVQRCDGTEGRINAAYAQGGPSCLVQTVSAASGIPVSHYLEVDFAGFLRLVDAVGGVSVQLDEPLVDVAAGIDLAAGCVVLDGREALGFVRARDQVGGDLGRIARQQRFLSELAESLASPVTLLNPVRLVSVVGTAARAVTSDQRTGPLDLARLAGAARGLAAGGLASYTVPTVAGRAGGADVQVPAAGADALFSRFADGSILEVPPGTGVAPQPGAVTVDVLNGAGVAGLAGQARDVLAARGFGIGAVGNTTPADTTVVLHAPGREAEALLVASQFAGVGTALSPAGGPDLALVLGPDADFSAPPPAPAAAPPAEGPPAGTAPADC